MYIHHGIIPPTLLVRYLDQARNPHISKPLNDNAKPARSLAQANRARSGERGSLAQAKPFSPRRERERGAVDSARSRSGETTPRSKRTHVA